MEFLKGVNPSSFLSTREEWHALVIGFCEVLCPWPPRHRSRYRELGEQIVSEYHYYMFGRAIGVIGWLISLRLQST